MGNISVWLSTDSVGHISRRSLMAVLSLWVALFAVYQEVGSHKPIEFDDGIYVTSNDRVLQGLSWENVKWAFTNVEAANWHPVTWLSHLLDQTVMPGGYGLQILEGVVWHGINASLLFCLLLRLGLGRGMAWALALVFVCHPLNVESVAWLSQRKNQLGLFFALLTVWQYLRQRENPTWLGMVWVCLWFGLSLMSKAMGVMLPVLVWVWEMLDLWQAGGRAYWRWQAWWAAGRTALVRVAPLLVLALAMCAVTFWAQRAMGAVVPEDQLSAMTRIMNACTSIGIYAQTFFVPGELTFFYPLSGTPNYQGAVLGVLTVAITSAVVLAYWRARPLIAWGWAWFLLSLLPVIGLVQVGMQSHADRYMYLPMIGILFIIGLVLPEILGRGLMLKRAYFWAVGGVVTFALGLGMQSRAYLLEWRTEQDAYSRSIAIGGPSYVMINNLARSYIAEDKYTQAMALAEEAVRLYPDDWRTLSLVGSAHLVLGQLSEAQAAFEGLIQRNPEKAFSGWVGISIVNLLRHDLVALKHSQQQANLAQATTDLSRLSPSEKSAFEYMRELMRSWEPRMQGVTSGAAPVPALGK